VEKTEVNSLNILNKKIPGNFLKKVFTSIDEIFIILGVLLNAISLITSFILGHVIAATILLVCELILIIIYFLKMI